MSLPQRLRQDVQKLSPKQLKELQTLLNQLIHKQKAVGETLPGKQGTVKRHYTYRREYVKYGKQGCSCAKGQGQRRA